MDTIRQGVREKCPIFEALRTANIFLIFKFHWNGALENYRRNNPGSELRKRQFPKLLAEVRFEVFTVMSIKKVVFWDLMPCSYG
jgi:hypothetical protein